MASGSPWPLCPPRRADQCENRCSLNAREECLPSASAEGWLPPTWLSGATGSPLASREAGMQASEEKVGAETRQACLLPFTSCGRSLVSEDRAISTSPGEALPGGM